MSLDLLQQADALHRGHGSVVGTQEPETRDAVLFHELVDIGDREARCIGGAHATHDDRPSPARPACWPDGGDTRLRVAGRGTMPA